MATNYIREFGQEFAERLIAFEHAVRDGDGNACDEARNDVIKFVKERVLESYRNGLNAVSLRVDTAARKLTRPVSRSKS